MIRKTFYSTPEKTLIHVTVQMLQSGKKSVSYCVEVAVELFIITNIKFIYSVNF